MIKCRTVDMYQFLMLKLPESLVMRVNYVDQNTTLLIICLTPTRQFTNWFLWRMKSQLLITPFQKFFVALLLQLYFLICTESGLWTSIFLLQCTKTLWPYIYMATVVLIYIPFISPDIFIRNPWKYIVWYILGWTFNLCIPYTVYLTLMCTTSCFKYIAMLPPDNFIMRTTQIAVKIYPLIFLGFNVTFLPLWWYMRLNRSKEGRQKISDPKTVVAILNSNQSHHSPFNCTSLLRWVAKWIALGAIINLLLFWVDIYSSMAASLQYYQDGKYLWSALILTFLSSGGIITAFCGLSEAPSALKILWAKNHNQTILGHILYQSYPMYLCEEILQKWRGMEEVQCKRAKTTMQLELSWTFCQRQ